MLKRLKEEVKLLKAELRVLIIAYKDSRTPFLPKLIVGLTVGYMLSPIDLIPDFIPVLGLLDDLIIVPLLIRASIRLIPPTVMLDARRTAKENPDQLEKRNWLFGMIIVLIWIAACILLFRWFFA